MKNFLQTNLSCIKMFVVGSCSFALGEIDVHLPSKLEMFDVKKAFLK